MKWITRERPKIDRVARLESPTDLAMKIAFLAVFVFIASKAAALDCVQTIPLPCVEGRIDHLALDESGRRLFAAALGNNSVEVVDLAEGKAIKSISGLSKPQGVFYLPELRRLVVANGGDGSCRFFEGGTSKQISSIQLKDDADNVRYDAKARLVYVGYGDGALAIIDPKEMKVTGDIPVGGHPESFRLEGEGRRIFVNVPDSHEIVVVDRVSKTRIGTFSLGMVSANFPMALDEGSHRLFVACRLPARLLVFDTATGRKVSETELHGDCDDLFVDQARHQIYASCGEGYLDVIGLDDADHYQRRESVKTAPGARTCWFDGKKIYLAVPHRNSQDAEIKVYQP